MSTKIEILLELATVAYALNEIDTTSNTLGAEPTSSQNFQNAVAAAVSLQNALLLSADWIGGDTSGINGATVASVLSIAAEIGTQAFVVGQKSQYYYHPETIPNGVSAVSWNELVAEYSKLSFMVSVLLVGIVLGVPLTTISIAVAVGSVILSQILDENSLANRLLGNILDIPSPLYHIVFDPLVLDLDGDGGELTSLENSAVHFDYDGDGFAEATGWVSSDDGLLVYDGNENGLVDGMGELFGSPTADGFAVLERHDLNGDGRIDAADGASFDKLRVWRDLDQDGEVDAGEMQTLEEAGIASINLTRTDVTGTNEGHDIGFEATFTRNDDTTGVAQTIYFQTDRQDTRADNTPNFTPAEGVDQLPQLPGSGQINSIAWKATQDVGFKADWKWRLAA